MLCVAGNHMFDLKHIRAVSLDVGGTLISPRMPVGAVYARLAGEFGVPSADAVLLDRQFAAAWRARGDFDYTRDSWYAIIRQSFGERAVELPAAFFPALYDYFAQAEAWHLHDDVLPALDALASRDIRLAIVSNWDDRLRPLLAAMRLDSYFDTIIPSCEIAFHKPSPVIFDMVIRRLGLPAGEVLHVGDHYQEDLEGARAAGLQALQLVRGGETKPPAQIHSLLELPALLDLAGCPLLTMSG